MERAQIKKIIEEVEARIAPLVERRAQDISHQLLREDLSIESIKHAYGNEFTWRGVPVTPDQYEALKAAYADEPLQIEIKTIPN